MPEPTEPRCIVCGRPTKQGGQFCSLACRSQDQAPPRVASQIARIEQGESKAKDDAERPATLFDSPKRR